MKQYIFFWLFAALCLTGCYPDEAFDIDRDAFFKLYGNGTRQEAVAMELSQEGDIFLIGNQELRNQDSCAVLIIRNGPDGNQRWSAKQYGLGYSKAKSMLILPSGELLLLAVSSLEEQGRKVSLLLKFDADGNLLDEYLPEGQEQAGSMSHIPEDMVPGEQGEVFVLGNTREASGRLVNVFILKVDIQSGRLLDRQVFGEADMMEAKRIFRNGKLLQIMGNTRQEEGAAMGQSMFMASFSPQLVPARHKVLGSEHLNFFQKAIFSSGQEYIILSTEQIPGSSSAEQKGVLNFIHPVSFESRHSLRLDNYEKEIPEAIEEDADGNYFVAFHTFGERGNSNIMLQKISPSGHRLWESPRSIGGEGHDRIVQVKIHQDYVYLLKTIDMQNENRLMSLSKIRF